MGGAGNNGSTNPFYPAAYENVIGVAATNYYDCHWSVGWGSTNYGDWVDVSAPVHNWLPSCIVTENGDSTFYYYSGATSTANAFVSGLAGLVKSRNLNLTSAEIFEIIRYSCDDIYDLACNYADSDSVYFGKLGWGRVNAYKAIHTIVAPSVITTDTEWDDHYVIMTGDVVVPDTVSLTIAPGTEIWVSVEDGEAGGLDEDKTELIVEGRLIAKGTAQNPIIFTSRPKTWDFHTGDWFGIRLEDGSTDTLTYCTIRYAEEGVRVENWTGDVLIEDCDISNCSDYGVHVVRSVGTRVCGNTLSDNPTGVFVQNYSNWNCDSVHVESNTIEAASEEGIYVEAMKLWGGVVLVEDNTIRDDLAVGIGVQGVHNLVLPAPDSVLTVIIQGNTVATGCSQMGIGVGDFLSYITYNDLQDLCTWGIMIDGGASRLKCNVINETLQAGVWTSTDSLDMGTSSQNRGNNCVEGSWNYHVKNTSPGTVYAKYNSWDPDPADSLFYGTVVWNPYKEGCNYATDCPEPNN